MDLAGDDAFELKLIFLRELGVGYVAAKAALELLQKDAADRAAMQELHNFFHKIAGTAAVVELGLLGRLAAVCETATDALLEGSLAANKHALQMFAEGLGGVASVLEGEVKAGALPAPEAG
ncbi:MAG TPA: hypothetical protein VE258_05610, partial [Ktedonobacterales bacterium]|nr:hypothetical protein [Ktedonobacterales bacterium]